MTGDIEAVLFDFGQTLVDSADGFRTAEKAAKEALFGDMRHRRGGLQWETFVARYREIRKAFHACSRLSRPDIWRAVYEAFGLSADDARLAAWERSYWQTVKANTRLFPETAGVLAELSRVYRLGLVTNTQGERGGGSHRISLFPGIERFFEVIVVAGEGDVPPKPDARAFMAALKAMRLPPERAVYVGDDWRNDVCGASEAGLLPVWLKHRRVRRNWPEGNGSVATIGDLRELAPLLTGGRE